VISNAEWKISIIDIAKGNGTATVTLKSGVQLSGKADAEHIGDAMVALFLTTKRGWHVIDYDQIAAITGEPS
jgi:hypothetical protein